MTAPKPYEGLDGARLVVGLDPAAADGAGMLYRFETMPDGTTRAFLMPAPAPVSSERNAVVDEALDLVRVLRAHAQARHDAARHNDREWSEAEISALDDAAHDIATLKTGP